MSAGPCAPNFEPGFDGLLAEPARNARAGDDEGLHADVLRARLDRGMHDLGRDVVLRRSRTHGCEVDSRFRGNDGEEAAPRAHGCEVDSRFHGNDGGSRPYAHGCEDRTQAGVVRLRRGAKRGRFRRRVGVSRGSCTSPA